MRIPLRRFGGDATTSYNWQIDVSNSAEDWYFQNSPQYNLDYAQCLTRHRPAEA